MLSLLELLAIVSYIGIFVAVLIVVYIRCSRENKRVLSSITMLIVLISLMMFTNNPLFQFLLFFLLILDLYYVVYVFILPKFYAGRESNLFMEVENEVWDELKITNTLEELKPKK